MSISLSTENKQNLRDKKQQLSMKEFHKKQRNIMTSHWNDSDNE